MKKNKISILEMIFGYGVIIIEFIKKRVNKSVERKEIINGKVVTVIDVEYREVA